MRAGELKAADLVEQSLKTIKSKQEYNAVIVTTETRARERAAQIDARVIKGEKLASWPGCPS